MHTATIEVAYVNEPKEGKKMGSVKTTDGEFYSVWPDKLANYLPGAVYEVEYTESDFKGKTYKTIKGVKSWSGRAAQAMPSKGVAGGAIGHDKSVEIFVTGTIQQCLQGAGSYPDVDTLTQWVRDARQAWLDGFADKPTSKLAADLDDEIPF